MWFIFDFFSDNDYKLELQVPHACHKADPALMNREKLKQKGESK